MPQGWDELWEEASPTAATSRELRAKYQLQATTINQKHATLPKTQKTYNSPPRHRQAVKNPSFPLKRGPRESVYYPRHREKRPVLKSRLLL